MKFEVTYKSALESLKSSGNTLLEAFNNLKIQKPKVLKASLLVKNGEKEKEVVFNMKKVRLFAKNEIFRSTWAKLLG